MPFVEDSGLYAPLSGEDVIEEVLRLLLSGQREEMNKLAINVGQAATTLTFEYELQGIRPGSLVNIDTETYRVWEIDGTNKTATVEPGMNGSISSSHSGGSLVYVNPRMSRHAIFKSLNDELAGLSTPNNGLFAVKTLEFTYSSSKSDYDITGSSQVLDVHRVRTSTPGPSDHWIDLTDWKLRRSSNTTTFPSGNALYVPYGVPGQTMQVVYSQPFAHLNASTDDIEDVAGLPRHMQDILALGVLLRLGPVREVKRNFTEAQQGARNSDEVPPQAVGNSFSYIRAQRQQRIDAEALRLAQAYPKRHR